MLSLIFCSILIFWDNGAGIWQKNLRDLTSNQSILSRLTYYQASIRLFSQSPLTGNGLWSFRKLVNRAQAEIAAKDPSYPGTYGNPKPRRVHNEYLEALNDGGIVATIPLAIFIFLIMRHGMIIINNRNIDPSIRTQALGIFCALTGIMLNALLFFPFRIVTTLFMTSLMAGCLEGLYLQYHPSPRFIALKHPLKKPYRFIFSLGTIFFLSWWVYTTSLRPLRGEMAFFQYQKAAASGQASYAQEHICKAIDLDPKNTLFAYHAAILYATAFHDYHQSMYYVNHAIEHFNGDVALWGLYEAKANICAQMGKQEEAQRLYRKTRYYNPEKQIP